MAKKSAIMEEHTFELAGCACSDDPCSCPPMEVPTCAHCGREESEHAGSGVHEVASITTVADYAMVDGELEAVDVEVDPRAALDFKEAFKGIEQEEHEGRPVTEHEISITGKTPIPFSNTQAREWFGHLRMGQKGQLIVWYEVGQDGFRPVTDEGVVVGVARFRKLKLTGISWKTNDDEDDGLPLFEHGSDRGTSDDVEKSEPGNPVFDALAGKICTCGHVVSVHGDELGMCAVDGCDCGDYVERPGSETICFCDHTYAHHATEETEDGYACSVGGCGCRRFDALVPSVEEEPSALAESLAIALTEKCGKVHRGHTSPCPFLAAECELAEVTA